MLIITKNKQVLMKWLYPNDQSPFETLQLTKKQQEEEEKDKIPKSKGKKANTHKSYQNKPKPIKLKRKVHSFNVILCTKQYIEVNVILQ